LKFRSPSAGGCLIDPLGETPALLEWGGDSGGYGGESPETLTHVLKEYLLPVISDEEIVNVAMIHERMKRAIKGHFYAKAARVMISLAKLFEFQ
jgi:hypothetical protein